MQSIAEELRSIDDFNELLPFLKDRMGWPIEQDILDEDDPLEESTFEFTPRELGIDPDKVSNIRGIHQLRPFYQEQPFGIFLISFEDKELKVTAMRRILRALVKKKRGSANAGTQQNWDVNDLMFISNFGLSGHRKISFAHFQQDSRTNELPTLRVIGWDEDDTPMRMRIQASELTQKLKFPDNPKDVDAWRSQWNGAFSQKPGQVIKTTKDLVSQLAKLATQTRRAIEDVLALENKNGVLHHIMNSFRGSIFPNLSPKDFADMYAQTVAYGLLQARISRISGGLVLDDAANLMGATNPFLKEIFESFLSVGENKSKLDFDEIGLSEVRDLLTTADMEQVLADFENKNPNQDPKIHLYENFLKEYDKDRKDSHGVFYTPREVVGFIVRSVHETLQTEFGLTDGLADITTWAEFAASHDDVTIPKGWADKPFVQILDPATGTGTFLIETIGLIFKHLSVKWSSEGKSETEKVALWQDYVSTHLLPRLHGFELMMAPYAMAHLGIALKLDETGYKHTKDTPRAKVYLTNSLAEPFDAYTTLGFIADALAEEGKGADHIKMDVPITIIIGNPPYSGHSMNNGIKWIKNAIKDYTNDFPDLQKPGQGKWLQDDYVKFIRFAKHVLKTRSHGVMGYITNHAYIDNPTFKGMRKSLVETFPHIEIVDLHGNLKKKEKAPNGNKDENVFLIQQGVAILIASKFGFDQSTELSKFDFWGKRSEKLQKLESQTMRQLMGVSFIPAEPTYMFLEMDVEFSSEYYLARSLPSIMNLNGDPAPGIVTTHDGFAISFTPEEQKEKINRLIESVDESEARNHFRLCKQDQWDYTKAKKYLSAIDWSVLLKPIAYRLFDERCTVYTSHVAVHLRNRVMQHMLERDNVGLVSVRQLSGAGLEWCHAFASNKIMESCHISNRTKEINYLFPLKLFPFGKTDADVKPNLSMPFLKSITAATNLDFQPLIMRKPEQQQLRILPKKLKQQDLLGRQLHERGDLTATFGCRDAFDYIYAILHCPAYRKRYAEFLKSDFPRIPLPNGRGIFAELISLGKELVELHLLDENHPKLVQPNIVFRGQGDNRLFKKPQIKWQNGKMPINLSQWFEDVPEESVEFSIGGYEPLKKWLHDRAEKGGKTPAQGRVLSDEDILHYRRMVVAITETRHLMQEIDNVIEAHGSWPDAFVTDNQ